MRCGHLRGTEKGSSVCGFLCRGIRLFCWHQLYLKGSLAQRPGSGTGLCGCSHRGLVWWGWVGEGKNCLGGGGWTQERCSYGPVQVGAPSPGVRAGWGVVCFCRCNLPLLSLDL